MNEVFQYELGYISFKELETLLWDFGKNAICEVGEDRFRFYIHKSCKFHDLDYYIEEWSYAIKKWNS